MSQTTILTREDAIDSFVEPTPVPYPTAGESMTEERGERRSRPEFARHRSITAHVTDGLDGLLKVTTMLRSRGYRVRDLSVDIREGVIESLITCTIALNTADTELLIERLRRVPVVVSAYNR
ncbi:MAG TPA: hypothetical protein VFE65_32540 [Pseudonocardia sp.]|nr:hypothetical protein [Pseudonocardia sp.]